MLFPAFPFSSMCLHVLLKDQPNFTGSDIYPDPLKKQRLCLCARTLFVCLIIFVGVFSANNKSYKE